ncbi:SIMPL domain-containing protein [Maribacter sp. MMG018]|uniref:SIMPL domain-containing protein n=1 Tax=Maribacter sp. MMG018 TaxID=2822688 RepID=UPI001B391834|nr:SIMPL domain-containing protein [Maribacter sp. MMG018]MBQ4913670.1 SIMPL domain-containing protein [Maribacter sp. MMG018]
MKKFIILCAVIGATAVNAQNKDLQKTISVTGMACVKRNVTAHKVKATLNMDQLYYSDPQIKSLKEFKEKYFEALKKTGFDPEKFVEKDMEFLTAGYQKEGTVLEFETTSEDTVKKLLAVKMNGVTLQYSFKTSIDQKTMDSLLKTALADATAKAQKLCDLTGQSLGEVISVTENLPLTDMWTGYYNDSDDFLTIAVTYSTK